MEELKKTRCTNRQKTTMINYMMTHNLFANGEYTGPLGGAKHQAEWDRLSKSLNAIGPEKSIVAWQRGSGVKNLADVVAGGSKIHTKQENRPKPILTIDLSAEHQI